MRTRTRTRIGPKSRLGRGGNLASRAIPNGRALGATIIAFAICPLLSGCGALRALYAPELTERRIITLTVRPALVESQVDTVAGQVSPVAQPEIARPGPGEEPVVMERKPSAQPPPQAIESPEPQPHTEEEAETAPQIATPSVSVALPAAEKAKLEAETHRDLAAAEARVSRAAPRAAGEADREKLRAIQGLIHQAVAALERDDIRGAANLAHKAKLLALALPTP
ncbi:MAG: hypothetical protein FJY88_06145 [Candidatus Eisenbacteria bacterium]|nr:hypothetical protein [Candidatus Eisenbacteria bacterium]